MRSIPGCHEEILDWTRKLIQLRRELYLAE